MVVGQILDILRGRVSAADLNLTASPTARAVSARPPTLLYSGTPLPGVEDARDYTRSATAYRCVQTIASNLASLDLTVIVGDEPRDDHPVARLWNRGTPGASFSARIAREVMFARAELHGEACCYIDRGEGGDGTPTGLWPIYDPVEILVDGSSTSLTGGPLLGWRVNTPRGKVDLRPGEVLWLRYPHPARAWQALAPWQAALAGAEADAYARAWQLGEFQRGARPTSVVYLGDLDEEQHRAAVADWRTGVEGPGNAGKALLVSGPAATKVDRMSMTPAEMSYLESRAANAAEVMLAFGVPRDYLVGGSTFDNQRAAKVALWSDVLVPKLDVLGSEVDRQLLPSETETAGWDLTNIEALQENLDAITGRVVRATYADVYTIDEARAAVGLDPLPGGIGAATMTPYRETIRAQLAAGQDQSARAVLARALAGPPARRCRIRGATIHVRATPRKLGKHTVLKAYDRHERIGSKVVRRLAAKQERVVLQKLRKLARTDLGPVEHRRHGPTQSRGPWSELPLQEPCGCTRIAADDIFDYGYWRRVSVETFDAWLGGVWDEGGVAAADGLGVSWDHYDPAVTAAMQARRDVLAGQVTDTTQHVLDYQLLQAGVEGGESIDELADRIKVVFTDLATWRAKTIARTETVGGFNAASHEVARASGVSASRTWVSTDDSRTRPTHVDLDGETILGFDAPYSNGCLHPGDPSGRPEETINCRCVEEFNVED
jgi:HK97 family phage portal protein